jgi:hypothetical protein
MPSTMMIRATPNIQPTWIDFFPFTYQQKKKKPAADGEEAPKKKKKVR